MERFGWRVTGRVQQRGEQLIAPVDIGPTARKGFA